MCVYLCVCPLASDYSQTIEVIIINLGMVTALDMTTHRVLIILTLTFIQGHTYLKHEDNKIDYFKNVSSNAHQVCCEDCPTKGLYVCQSDELDLRARSQLRLKLDKVLTCSFNVISLKTFKLLYSRLA